MKQLILTWGCFVSLSIFFFIAEAMIGKAAPTRGSAQQVAQLELYHKAAEILGGCYAVAVLLACVSVVHGTSRMQRDGQVHSKIAVGFIAGTQLLILLFLGVVLAFIGMLIGYGPRLQ